MILVGFEEGMKTWNTCTLCLDSSTHVKCLMKGLGEVRMCDYMKWLDICEWNMIMM